MTVDLWCLAANAMWGFLLVLIEIGGKTSAAGPAWNAGNRAQSPDFPSWVGRASRSLSNHKENFPFFLTAVVVVQLAGKADRTSAIACVTFVVARVFHGLLYIAGVEKVRTVAWMVGTLSALVVFSRLLT